MTCPKCDAEWRVKDELAGKKTRCPECEEVVPVPARRGREEDEDEEEIVDAVIEDDVEEVVAVEEEEEEKAISRAPRRKPPVEDPDEEDEDLPPARLRAAPRDEEEEEDEEEEAPRRRGREKPAKKSSAMTWILVTLGVLFVLCAGGAGTAAYIIWSSAKAVGEGVQEWGQQVKQQAEQQAEQQQAAAKAKVETDLVGQWKFMNFQNSNTIYEFEKGGTYYIYTIGVPDPHKQPLKYEVPTQNTVVLTTPKGESQHYSPIFIDANQVTLLPQVDDMGRMLPDAQGLHLHRYDPSRDPQSKPPVRPGTTTTPGTLPAPVGNYKELIVGKWSDNLRSWTFGADGKVEMQSKAVQYHGTYTFNPANPREITLAEAPGTPPSRVYSGTYTIDITDDTLKLARAPLPLERARGYKRDTSNSTPVPAGEASALKGHIEGKWSSNALFWQFGGGVDGGTLVIQIANERFKGSYALSGRDGFKVIVQGAKVDDLNGIYHATIAPDGKTMKAWRDGQKPDTAQDFIRVGEN